jgi:hypothetical protein
MSTPSKPKRTPFYFKDRSSFRHLRRSSGFQNSPPPSSSKFSASDNTLLQEEGDLVAYDLAPARLRELSEELKVLNSIELMVTYDVNMADWTPWYRCVFLLHVFEDIL